MDSIYNLNWSNYAAFKCSPICIVDPTGETDYYNLAGDWIGTDRISNTLKTVVTDNKILKAIVKRSRKGLDYTTSLPNGTFYQLPSKNVRDAIIAIFNASQSDVPNSTGTGVKNHGGQHEAATTFDSDGNQTLITHGSDVNQYNTDARAPIQLVVEKFQFTFILVVYFKTPLIMNLSHMMLNDLLQKIEKKMMREFLKIMI